ncbi:uncharacterized protein LOC119679715 [Teleopsis dalmanni]|uniref:uncharacterized protein LOC119679715 n=1 Tax=Teleopsis dalmanni TaxID=139649 RepID=UPI0018CCE96C|nr:uncharacterized protein LOC119679715 [Teleopsis dalmanni]
MRAMLLSVARHPQHAAKAASARMQQYSASIYYARCGTVRTMRRITIEVDDQITKPLNLANSAVLRAVEEEEEMKCERTAVRPCSRPSRSRQRYEHQQPHTPLHQQQLEQIKTQYLSHQHDITIDRDTVLKINRLTTRKNLHKRDHSWPPPTVESKENYADLTTTKTTNGTDGTEGTTGAAKYKARSSSNDNVVYFDDSVCKRHGIDELRAKFNSPTRIIEPTAKEVQQHRKMAKLKQERKEIQTKAHTEHLQKNVTNKSMLVNTHRSEKLTNVSNNKDNTSLTKMAETRKDAVELPTKAQTDIFSEEQKGKEARDDAVIIEVVDDVGNVTDAAYTNGNTPTIRGFSAPETKAADEYIGLVEPKRKYYEQLAKDTKKWHSYDNIANKLELSQTAEKIASSKAMQKHHNRQSYSLERGRAKMRRQQLPPLKPRTSSGGVGATDNLVSLTASCCNLSKSPKLQRRSIKLATEIKICYDDDAEKVASKNNKSATIISKNKPLPESIKSQQSNLITTAADLEHIPLPPTPLEKNKNLCDIEPVHDNEQTLSNHPRISERYLQQQQQQNNHMLQYNKNVNLAQKHMPQTHIIPVTLERYQERQHAEKYDISENIYDNVKKISSDFKQQKEAALNTLSAQQIYDDACIYLRSIDLQENTVAYIPAAITIVPSPTEEVLEHWTEAKNLRANIQKADHIQPLPPVTITPPTTPPPPPPPPVPPPPPTRATNENLIQMATKDASTTQHNKQEVMLQVGNPTENDNISSDLTEIPTYTIHLPAAHSSGGTQHQDSVTKLKSNPNSTQSTTQALNLKTPLGHVNNAAKTTTTKARATTIPNTNKSLTNPSNAEQQMRRQGIYYTDGEDVYGPFKSTELYDSNTQMHAISHRNQKPKKMQSLGSENVGTVNVAIATADDSGTDADADAEIKNEIDAIKCKRDRKLGQTRVGVGIQGRNLDQQATENKIEIALLEAKYGQIQQSITEHLKQIDTYMANAKMALNRTLLSEQEAIPYIAWHDVVGAKSKEPPNAMAAIQTREVETPLQFVLKQMHCHQAKAAKPNEHNGEECSNVKTAEELNDTTIHAQEVEVIKPVENMPIVEEALHDLANIAESILACEHKLRKQAATIENSNLSAILNKDSEAVQYKIPINRHLTAEIDEEKATDLKLTTSLLTSIPVTTTTSGIKMENGYKGINKQNQNSNSSADISSQALTSKQHLEHVADVVASYEQLSATDNTTESTPEHAKLFQINIDANIGSQTPTPTTSATTTSSKTLPRAMQHAAQVVEQQQVIDTNQVKGNHTLAVTTLAANLNQQQVEHQLQSATNNEKDVAILPRQLSCTSSTTSSDTNESKMPTIKLKEINKKEIFKQQEKNIRERANMVNASVYDNDITVSTTTGTNNNARKFKATLSDQCPAHQKSTAKATDNYDTYKATYEIKQTPYTSRQFSLEQEHALPKKVSDTLKTEVQIAHETVSKGMRVANCQVQKVQKTESVKSSKVTQEPQLVEHYEQCFEGEVLESARAATPNLSFRKYPAPLIEPNVPPRAASPFGLNALEATRSRTRTPSPIPPFSLEAKYTYVPQVEGHNIGLLVHTAMPPMSSTKEPQTSKREHCSTRSSQSLASTCAGSTLLTGVAADNDYTNVDADIDVGVDGDDDGNVEGGGDGDDDSDGDYNVATDVAVNVDDFVELQRINAIVATDKGKYNTKQTTSNAATALTSTLSYSQSTAPTTNSIRASNLKSIKEATDDNRSYKQPPTYEFIIQQQQQHYRQSPQKNLLSTTNVTADSSNVGAHKSVKGFEVTPNTTTPMQEQQQQQRHQYCTTSSESTIINRTFDNVSPRPYITIEGMIYVL